ncbi:MAG: hypothetical protein LBT80_09670 [Lactobacillaceae bacterium]|nr:hypothetical protein [Lactobacillaceae bacterium]
MNEKECYQLYQELKGQMVAILADDGKTYVGKLIGFNNSIDHETYNEETDDFVNDELYSVDIQKPGITTSAIEITQDEIKSIVKYDD